MDKQNNESGLNNQLAQNKLDNPHHGPDGVDKAPGEESSDDKVQFIQESQKGKKVDADPSVESDKPIKQSL
jgi:hypothetical protein